MVPAAVVPLEFLRREIPLKRSDAEPNFIFLFAGQADTATKFNANLVGSLLQIRADGLRER